MDALAPPRRTTWRLDRMDHTQDRHLALWLAAAVAVVVFGFFSFAATASPDTWVPIVVAVFIGALSIPLCMWLAHGDNRLRKLLILGLILKLAAVGPRYYVNEVFYKGEVDATRYDAAGGVFLQEFAEGKWTIEGTELAAYPKQTRFVGYVTGVLYLAFGTSFVGGYLVYSWVAWLGLIGFLQAFRLAFPNAPPYRAAGLLLFFPSVLFWPSSPGKDALMLFAVGVATYGIATVIYRKHWPWGLPLAVLGALLLYSVRPHILLVVVAGLAGALIARSNPRGSGSTLWPIFVRLVLLALLVPALFIGLDAVDESLGEGEGNLDITSTFDQTADNTAIGESAFDVQGVRTPADLPFAMVSVPLRPFLFEARSPQLLLSALEGTALLAAGALSARWLWMALPAIRRSPLAAFCAVYFMAFVIAFSNIGNAGILSRQRVQLFPLLFLLACCGRALYDERVAAIAASRTDGADDDLDDPTTVDHLPELAWSRT